MCLLFVEFLAKSNNETIRFETEKIVLKTLGKSQLVKGKESYTKLCSHLSKEISA